MSEWQTVPAEDFCASVRDGTHDSPKPVEHGRFLVTSRHIVGGRLDLSNAYLISQEDFDAINKRSKVNQWDVLISMIGTVGEPCLIKAEPNFAIKNIGLFKSKGELEGKWLYYYLRNPSTQQIIKEQSRGTTQQYIPLGALRGFPISAPVDKNEMRAIVDILGTLDDKIELNRRMNETLEAIARAMFKSWFVDFDPVRAKMSGEPPESICQRLGLTPDLLALFPDRLVDSELGEIPEGWKVEKLSELCTLGRGASPRPINDFMNGEVPWVKIADATSAAGPFLFETREKLKMEGVAKSVTVAPGDLILSNSATCGVPIFVELHGCIHDGWLYFKNLRSISKLYLYHVLIALAEHLIHVADGSVQKNLNTNLVGSQNILVPPKQLADLFDSQVNPIFSKIRQVTLESRALSEVRDTLLPKLLSGELRVPAVEPEYA